MASVGVVYLLTGAGLADRLVVSLHSLRQWYDGPITLMTTRAESHEIGQLCENDRRTKVEHVAVREAVAPGYSSSYVTKVTAIASAPYDSVVFLDADTLVVGDITPLFESAITHPLTATAFCDVTTNSETMKERLLAWMNGPIQANKTLLRQLKTLLEFPFAAVNAGVVAIERTSAPMAYWSSLTQHARSLPLPDEIALQLTVMRFPHALLGTSFNCFPTFKVARESVRIWHFCAGSHLNTMEGRRLWLPEYESCRNANLAGLKHWSRIQRIG